MSRITMKPNPDMWGLWRDFYTSSKTWRMRTPIGVLSFATKKAALAARAEYERVKAREAGSASARKASPTPRLWEIGHRGDGTPVITQEARDVAVMENYYGDGDANAALIVKAVNAHEALLTIVRRAYERSDQHMQGADPRFHEDCAAALRLAGESR